MKLSIRLALPWVILAAAFAMQAPQPVQVFNTCCYTGSVPSMDLGAIPFGTCSSPVNLSINTFPQASPFTVTGQVGGTGIVPVSLPMNFDATSRTFVFPIVFCPPNVNAVAPVVSFTDVGAGGSQTRTFNMRNTVTDPTKDGDGAQPVADPVSAATGEYFLSAPRNDLALGGKPLALMLQRYYASYLRENGFSGTIGNNWMHNFEVRLQTSAGDAVVTRFGGRTFRFRQSGNVWNLVVRSERLGFQLLRGAANWRFYDPETMLIYTFADSGRLNAVEDRNGNTLTVTYNGSDPGPTRVADGLGRTLDFTYSSGKLASVRDQGGRTVQYRYQVDDLVEFTDADGRRTQYRYTAQGRRVGLLTAEVLPLGNVPLTQEYDAGGRVSKQTDSRGNVSTFAYDTATGKTTVTDAAGNVNVYTHSSYVLTAAQNPVAADTRAIDANGRVTSITAKDGARSTITYHPQTGFPASITDAAGNVTRFEYSSQTQNGFTFYNLTQVTRPGGEVMQFAYDDKGNLTKTTDEMNREWTATYNSRGQVTAETNPAGGVSRRTYNADGTLATTVRPSGATVSYGYDTLKRANSARFAGDIVRKIDFDNLNRPVAFTDELANTVKLAYDNNGNLLTLTDELGNVRRMRWDNDQRLSAGVNRLGGERLLTYGKTGDSETVTSPSGAKVTFTLNSRNLVASAAGAGNKASRYAYDAASRLTSVTDPSGNATTISRDAAGRVTRVTNGAGGTNEASYDRNGLLSSRRNGAGVSATFTRDRRGLLTGITLPGEVSTTIERSTLGLISAYTDPNGSVWRRRYDAGGRLTSTTDPLGNETAYSYNSRGLVESISPPGNSITNTYDAAGNITRMEYADGTAANFTYDSRGYLTKADGADFAYDADGWLINSNGIGMQRNRAGQITAMSYGGDRVVAYTYDEWGRLARVTDWLGGATTFSYDDNGNVAALTRPNGIATRFTFDKANRLTGIEDSGLASIALTLDGAGRVTAAQRDLPAPTAAANGVSGNSYDAASQVAEFQYDAQGRLSQDDIRSYSWSGDARLASYDGANGSAWFSYDALGGRVGRISAGQNRYFVLNYAFQLPMPGVVRNDDGDLRYYVYSPGGALLYSVDAATSARRFYHFDEMGTTTMLSGDDGAITDTYFVTPYGETAVHTGETENPFTFLGAMGVMQEGETWLYYMRERYYDARTARFLSRDPVLAIDPLQVNPYQYAAGNPMQNADPSGRCNCSGQNRVDAASNIAFPAGWAASSLFQIGGTILENAANAPTERILAQASNNLFDFFEGALQGGQMAEDGTIAAGETFERAVQRVDFMFNGKIPNYVDGVGDVSRGELLTKRVWWQQELPAQLAKAEEEAAPALKTASRLKTFGQGLGLALAAVQTGFNVHDDIQRDAGFVLTSTDAMATFSTGAAVTLVPGAGLVDLGTGGTLSGGIHNALMTPNTVAKLALDRTTTKDADNIKHIYTRFAVGRWAWNAGEWWSDTITNCFN